MCSAPWLPLAQPEFRPHPQLITALAEDSSPKGLGMCQLPRGKAKKAGQELGDQNQHETVYKFRWARGA